ncbi:hypothetical protein B9Z55_026322 [Caenorhabditis nigoni]|uniref:Uncharacterized protein n=1 Tax=Caenorhabditis nigoni TaxID=1611254 RepID=A0A2G5T2N4_9PELO|nr:hypothetical protein B9Z55_026322 [Caenorhabditis nigoni]
MNCSEGVVRIVDFVRNFEKARNSAAKATEYIETLKKLWKIRRRRQQGGGTNVRILTARAEKYSKQMKRKCRCTQAEPSSADWSKDRRKENTVESFFVLISKESSRKKQWNQEVEAYNKFWKLKRKQELPMWEF